MNPIFTNRLAITINLESERSQPYMRAPEDEILVYNGPALNEALSEEI